MKEKKITPFELIAIIIYSILLFFTLNFPIAFSIAMISMIILLILDNIREKHIKKINYVGTAGIIILILLYLIDFLQTFLAVKYLKIAKETNEWILYAWDKYGYLNAEMLRITLITFFIFIPLLFLVNSKNKQLALFSYIMILYYLSIFSFVVFSNFIVMLF